MGKMPDYYDCSATRASTPNSLIAIRFRLDFLSFSGHPAFESMLKPINNAQLSKFLISR